MILPAGLTMVPHTCCECPNPKLFDKGSRKRSGASPPAVACTQRSAALRWHRACCGQNLSPPHKHALISQASTMAYLRAIQMASRSPILDPRHLCAEKLVRIGSGTGKQDRPWGSMRQGHGAYRCSHAQAIAHPKLYAKVLLSKCDFDGARCTSSSHKAVVHQFCH